jgi:maltose O-acetyltransferase
MPSEWDKMVRGERYDPLDAALVAARRRARHIMHAINLGDGDDDERRRLLRQLLPASDDTLWIEPPFYCDYGTNIVLGKRVYFNFNCVVLDVAKVTIGSRVLFGPSVHVYAATHPTSATERMTGLELGEPVTIDDDVWVGGAVVICPGVRIGARSVIGAGSVVTRDIPADVVAAGNPCRVLRALERKP